MTLGIPLPGADTDIGELDHPLLEECGRLAELAPRGQKRILSIDHPLVYRVTHGRWRGASWVDEEHKLFWLLAAEQRDRCEKTSSVFDSNEAGPSHEKAFKLAQALGEAGRPEEIPELLEPWLHDDVSEWDAVTVDVLLHAYEKSGAAAEIEQLVARLLE